MGALGLLLVLALPLGAIFAAASAARSGSIPNWVAVVYLGASALTFLAYAVDKYRAVRNLWRIPESTLHLLEAAGGWPGAFVAQRLLRHKTRKLSYQITYWLIVLAHLAFWSWFATTKPGDLPT